jgi:hypothetical protein
MLPLNVAIVYFFQVFVVVVIVGVSVRQTVFASPYHSLAICFNFFVLFVAVVMLSNFFFFFSMF